jgi:cell wall-associated NlpC family hydrolase
LILGACRLRWWAVAGKTCRNRRNYARIATLGGAISLVAAAGPGLAGTPAAATPTAPSQSDISAVQQQIVALESTIAQQQAQGDALAQKYDGAVAQLQKTQANLAAISASMTATRATLAADKAELARDAVHAYVYATADTHFTSLFTSPATKSDARKQYEDMVVGNITQAADTLAADQARLLAEQSQQQTQLQQETATATLTEALSAANANQTKIAETALAQAKGALAQEIAQYAATQAQAAAAAAARAAADRNAAAARAAADAAANAASVAGAVGGTGSAASASAAAAAQSAAQAAASAGVVVAGSTIGSAAGHQAVQAALSQLGVPYVWGGETPGVGFDCSGLTQWAWSQAQVSIPRTSGAQWSGLHPVPLTSLQPGDLIFSEGTPPGHVVMYVGSGPYGSETVIQAPHTGAVVSFTSALYLGAITGAARP